jgi:uncharacterized protein YndB with AHSA1/START domain
VTTTRQETTIVVDDSLPVIRITREFAAPVARVFRAHTDPELFARWNGPSSHVTVIGDWDCRTGGAWRFDTRDGDDVHRFFGSFHEVEPDASIVRTFAYERRPGSVVLERLSFEDLGDGRTRLVATSTCETFEDRDGLVAGGMEAGVREAYDALGALVESGTIEEADG